MHFDFPERICVHHQSLSLSLSLSLFTFVKTAWIQIRFDWNSGKNVSSIKKCVHAIESTQADAHDKMCFQYISISVYICRSHARIQMGGQGVLTYPLKNHKNIEFLSNTGPDPLKFSKLPSQHSTLDHYRHASETPFKWCFAAGPMMARF